jgi:TPR repeat protein
MYTHTHILTQTQEGVPGDVEQDFEKAIAFTRKAAEKGDPESMHMLAVVSIYGFLLILNSGYDKSC